MRIDSQLARWAGENKREQKPLKTVYWNAWGSF